MESFWHPVTTLMYELGFILDGGNVEYRRWWKTVQLIEEATQVYIFLGWQAYDVCCSVIYRLSRSEYACMFHVPGLGCSGHLGDHRMSSHPYIFHVYIQSYGYLFTLAQYLQIPKGPRFTDTQCQQILQIKPRCSPNIPRENEAESNSQNQTIANWALLSDEHKWEMDGQFPY